MKIKISAESSIDFPKELLKEYDISTVAFKILLGEKEYLDGEVDNEKIFEYVSKSKKLPKTGAVNISQFVDHFSELLKSCDAVIHISLSSKLSSAFDNAVVAAREFKNIYVIDSRSLSAGIGLLAIYAKKLADQGESAQNIVSAVNKRIPFVQVSSELKRVDYLYKGGRCNALVFLGANILRIRPQIVVKDGRLISGKKYRGSFENVVKRYCDDTLTEFDTPDLSVAFLAYTSASPDILKIAYDKLKERGFEKVYVVRAGATITSHTGEDCLGIYYINDGDDSCLPTDM